MSADDRQREALRQQMLLRAIWRDARPAVVGGWLRAGPKLQRGLQAYQANAGALAERSLSAAYPTVQQLVGGDSFAALARAFWHRHPPERGDIAEWGGELAAFVAADDQLATEPYLADVARLEWALHQAARAADAGAPAGLELLATADPARLRILLAAGTALIVSPHPVATIWHAHRRAGTAAPSAAAEGGDREDREDRDDPYATVRAAFAAGLGETVLVQRHGWQAVVRALPAPEAAFTAAVLQGRALGAALDAAPGFEFEPWLLAALSAGTLAIIEETPA